jgi:hypothetical protein
MDIGTKEAYGYGMDPIVIRKHVDGVKGGVLLDVTGFTEEYVRCGHVIIRKTVEGKDVYMPMPVSDGAYASLPQGAVYYGICEATKSTAEPIVAVLTIGEVNDKALPFSIDSIKAAFMAAVPTIRFDHDN